MILQADARAMPLRAACVQCVVTSPPYFGLRDYGIAGQIGLESTPAEYVAQIVAVFREVRRVLTDDGVCWLNLGDSYDVQSGVLVGIPWRVSLALIADDWKCQADIVWSKPIGAPTGGNTRPIRTHEFVFMFTKRNRGYYYDAESIREPLAASTIERYRYSVKAIRSRRSGADRPKILIPNPDGRHRRSVWTIAPTRFTGAHFATMPEKLVEPCILAGSRLGDRVLDPFGGSGTVGAVAERLGRRWVATDLNPRYNALAVTRTAQRGLRFEVGA